MRDINDNRSTREKTTRGRDGKEGTVAAWKTRLLEAGSLSLEQYVLRLRKRSESNISSTAERQPHDVKHDGQQRLDAIFKVPSPVEVIIWMDLSGLSEPQDSALKAEHKKIMHELDKLAVQQLTKQGVLETLLCPEGVSLSWMFLDNDDQFYLALEKWACPAVESGRFVFLTTYRFWNMLRYSFNKSDGRKALVLSRSLSFLAVTQGYYSDAIEIANYWCTQQDAIIDQEVLKGEFDLYEERLLIILHKATAYGCKGKTSDANGYFSIVERQIEDGKSLEKKKLIAQHVSRQRIEECERRWISYRRDLYREKIRMFNRILTKSITEQSLSSGSFLNGMPRLDERRLRVLGSLLDLYRIELKRAGYECLDHDSEAKTLFFLGKYQEAETAVERGILLWNSRNDDPSKAEDVRYSLLVRDCLRSTHILCLLATENYKTSIRELQEFLSVPMQKRRHTVGIAESFASVLALLKAKGL